MNRLIITAIFCFSLSIAEAVTPTPTPTPLSFGKVPHATTLPADWYITGGHLVAPGGGGGTPGGSDTQVQFNDGGAFGGSAAFTFDKTTGNTAFGDFTGSGGDRIEFVLDNTNSKVSLGDVTHFNGGIALILDSGNQRAVLGDFNDQNKDMNLLINDQQGLIALGDIFNLIYSGTPAVNGDQIVLRDIAQTIKMGDVANYRQGTILEVDSPSGGRQVAVSFLLPSPSPAMTAFAVTPSGCALKGTTTNDNATALNVGEYISSLVAIGSPQSLSTGTAADVTSISLTAGDWDVEGNVNFTETTSTVTARSAGVSTTSATLPTDGSEAYCGVQSTVTSETNSITLPRKRISIASTTTVYLVGKATFSAGTCAGFGGLTARRVR